ncbi:MAG TPA: 2-hydroxyacid dehydrogenase [Verrucomicrobiota bacterium]|nr:2-hydroxyacid dehydrogenase [Verrucomicrobiota bacterium]
MLEVAVYDSKPYDRDSLPFAPNAKKLKWRFHDFRLTKDTAGTAHGADCVCVFVNDRVDAGCLRQLSKAGVRMIALRCAGFNNVDLETAKKLGLSVTRVPAYSPHAVAEHAVALLLSLNRKIHRANNRVRELNFSLTGLVGQEIYGKTVGVVGTGKIGKITAQIFRGFDAKVLVYDPFPDLQWAKRYDVHYVKPAAMLKRCDIISLNLPLTPQTKHLLNEKTLARMKRGVIIINTSRGKLIDTKALINALKSGLVGGVALDVYEEEEGIFFEDLSGRVLHDDVLSRLLTFPNVLITAHQAFLTNEGLGEIARVTVENILRFQSRKPFLDGTSLAAK